VGVEVAMGVAGRGVEVGRGVAVRVAEGAMAMAVVATAAAGALAVGVTQRPQPVRSKAVINPINRCVIKFYPFGNRFAGVK
jgi:hypothetical protein